MSNRLFDFIFNSATCDKLFLNHKISQKIGQIEIIEVIIVIRIYLTEKDNEQHNKKIMSQVNLCNLT